jgi:NAD(P)-dependent dehydrogenase (short-subunit alcohol dehydrogenase family)
MPKARHVVVTGGGRGIGAATARRFKELGYRVTLRISIALSGCQF